MPDEAAPALCCTRACRSKLHLACQLGCTDPMEVTYRSPMLLITFKTSQMASGQIATQSCLIKCAVRQGNTVV